MNTMLTEHHFDDRAGLFAALQKHIESQLSQGLAENSKASIALSGGSTPAPLYESLAQSSAVDWSAMEVTLSDERYVPVDHADSNEAMIHRTLLRGPAAAASFVSLMQSTDSAEQAAQISSDSLAKMQLPLDLLILGMGNDMHTASLFPDAAELQQAMSPEQQQLCLAIHPASSEYPRLSMSLNMLLNSREIVLLITGEDKYETLQKALASESTEQAPIAAILQQSTVPVHIYWSP